MKRLLLAAALAGSAAPLAAQVMPAPAIAAGHTMLTISAEGRSNRAPDLAVFSAGVTSQGKTAGEALAQNAAAMTRVIAQLKAAGIAERDIQTNNLSINPIYRDPNREAMMTARMSGQPYVAPPPESQIPTIIGYTANNQVSVRQRRLGDYGKVIDTLASAGANQINGPAFQMDNADPYLDEVRIVALRNARARAELYARAAGLRIDHIVSISESGGYFAPPPMFARGEAMMASAPPPPPSPVQPGELQLTASVTVVFDLAP